MIDSIYDKLMVFGWFESFVEIVLNLGSTELCLIVALLAVLVAYLVYKKTGVGGLGALLLIYLIAYILFQFDLINFYEERNVIQKEYNKTIEEELQK
ncbi:hypothetical protein KAJ89_01295 [Candidatus Parcubacteria bacterium]|nr:hypothetical protein [Candidatus Parcubacteria bacterium]